MRIAIVAFVILLCSLGYEKPPKDIVLPKEIQKAQIGDELEVYKITRTTIYIGFKSPRHYEKRY